MINNVIIFYRKKYLQKKYQNMMGNSRKFLKRKKCQIVETLNENEPNQNCRKK